MTAKLIGAEAIQRRLAAIRSKSGDRAMMNALGLETERRAKANTRVFRKTGNLGREIRTERVSDDSVTVVSGAVYGAVVEKGSRAHIIRPRFAKALRWATGAGGARLSGTPRRGAAVAFARFVRHPGTKPQPYLLPAARSVIRDTDIPKGSIVTRWNGAA